jgi:ADP-L-glycero-D-manno-heptose 6-epimerase
MGHLKLVYELKANLMPNASFLDKAKLVYSRPMEEKNWIILTGGAGFIGSNVLKLLNQRGEREIVVVDELGHDDKWKNLVGKEFLEYFHKDKLFDWLPQYIHKVKAIIHLGACSSTVETNADYLMENNTEYSKKLARIALDHEIRFIYASSAATYGDGSGGFSDDHDLLETLRPLNMYGFSKHLFDLWLKREGVLDRVVGLKYFNVYGPNEYHKGRMSSAVLKMVPQLKQEGELKLFCSSDPGQFADGEQVRDFIHVKEAAEMTLQFLDNELGGIFNIGCGRAETWKSLAQGVIEGCGGKGSISFVEMPKDLIGKYQNYTCADLHKSEKHGLYLPKRSLKECVVDYVQKYILEEAYR